MKKKIRSILLMFLIVCLLAACGSADMAASAPAPTPAPPAPAAAAPEASAPDFVAGSPGIGGGVAEEAETDYFNFPILTPEDAGDRRLIYYVSMQLQTKDFLPGMRLLLDTVAEANGYLVSADVWGADWRRPLTEQSASFRFRIPTEQLATFIFVVENNYNIWSLQQHMHEATVWYQQTGWSLDDLRERESELVELLETDIQSDQRTAATEELREVRRHIRELTASQAAIMTDVVYSTIDVMLFEVFPPAEETTSAATIVAWATLGSFVLVGIIVLIVALKKSANKPNEVNKGHWEQ